MSKALIFFIFMQAFTTELCNRIITFNVKNLRYVSKHIFFVRVNVELEIIDRLEYIDPETGKAIKDPELQKNAPQKTTTFDIDRNLALANIDSNVDILKIHLDYHTKSICPITGNVRRPGADIKRDLNRLNDYVIYWNGYFQTDNLQNLTHIIETTHCRIAKYGFQLKRVELHPLEEVKKISFYLYAASVRLIIHDNPSFFDHTLFNDYILYKTKNKLPFEAEDIVDEMVRIRHYSII